MEYRSKNPYGSIGSEVDSPSYRVLKPRAAEVRGSMKKKPFILTPSPRLTIRCPRCGLLVEPEHSCKGRSHADARRRTAQRGLFAAAPAAALKDGSDPA